MGIGLVSALAQSQGWTLKLNCQSFFTQTPWRMKFTNYDFLVDAGGLEYYFTVSLVENAGAHLEGLVITETSGSDQSFWIDPKQTSAFFSRPRQESEAIPVQAQFHEQKRTMRVGLSRSTSPRFNADRGPVAAKQSLMNSLYPFAIEALPAGPNPAPAPLGFAGMEILDGWDR